jgi:hypothetical protein
MHEKLQQHPTLHILDDLIERDAGTCAGVLNNLLPDVPGAKTFWYRGKQYVESAPGYEDNPLLYGRCMTALELIIGLRSRLAPGAKAIISSHGGFLQMLEVVARGLPAEAFYTMGKIENAVPYQLGKLPQ